MPQLNYIKPDKLPFLTGERFTFYGETLSMIPFDFCKVFDLFSQKQMKVS